ncbi:hypothetical protein CN613_25520 [Bacillus pseudomycoides]|uniref:Uncharacterized protein n=1 Tax=Bacillus pseudomycoides TaxID=64104 RepID=A0A2A8BYG6_9BACI|nr:hypothetical protein [Bacillus pseudomycoides]PEM65306.1 hypothetical protein CN613_25520 [Bacillus pseudomycoides]
MLDFTTINIKQMTMLELLQNYEKAYYITKIQPSFIVVLNELRSELGDRLNQAGLLTKEDIQMLLTEA